MKAEDVPGEWTNAAWTAFLHPPGKWAETSAMMALAHAIAAVAPLIAAAARESCAKVAERRWRDWPGIHPDDAKKGEVCDDVTACADIAAAIRSRTGDK